MIKKGLVFVFLSLIAACSLVRDARITPIKTPIAFHLSQYTPFKNALQLPREGKWGYGYVATTPILTEADLQQAYRIKERAGKEKISLVLSEQGVRKIRQTMNRMDDVQIAIIIDKKIVKTLVFRVNEVVPYVINIP